LGLKIFGAKISAKKACVKMLMKLTPGSKPSWSAFAALLSEIHNKLMID